MNTNVSQYEYAVLIPTDTYHQPLTNLTTAQETSGDKVYEVLKTDSTAHVVRFLKSPKSWSNLTHPIVGYVIFARPSSLPSLGPLASVSEGNCLIMAEVTTEFVYLSISSPDLNLRSSSGPLTNSDYVGQEELYQSSSQEREIEVTLSRPVQKRIISLQAHGDPHCYKPYVLVDTRSRIRFLNLKNGFSVEVKLKLRPP